MVAPRTNTGGATAPPGLWRRTTASVTASPMARLRTGVPHTLVSEDLAGRSARSSRVARLDGANGREGTARARCLGAASWSDAAPTSLIQRVGLREARHPARDRHQKGHDRIARWYMGARPRLAGGRQHRPRPASCPMKMGVGKGATERLPRRMKNNQSEEVLSSHTLTA